MNVNFNQIYNTSRVEAALLVYLIFVKDICSLCSEKTLYRDKLGKIYIVQNEQT